MTWYVGHQHITGILIAFTSFETPEPDTHGHRFGAVIGPFKTKRAANWAAKFGKGNPHFQTVDDAKRLSKLKG
jgi:hypothetical protein